MGGRRSDADLPERVAGLAAARLPWDVFAAECLDLVTDRIGVDAAILAPFDPVSGRITGSLTRDIPHTAYPAFAHHEYVEPDLGTFDDLSRRTDPVGILHEDAGGDPQRSARHRELLRPVLGLTHEVRLAGLARGRLWAGLSLFRAVGEKGFTAGQIGELRALGPSLAAGMRSSALHPGATVTALDPAVLTVDPDGRLLACSADTDHWFGLLDPGRTRALPIVVVTAAATARREERADVTVTVPGVGPVRVHAAALSDGSIAVTLDLSSGARRAEHTARLLGLSDRETQVARLSLAGSSTRQIARTLGISEYTVQDHFRSIFRAAGVRSRAELGAVLRG